MMEGLSSKELDVIVVVLLNSVLDEKQFIEAVQGSKSLSVAEKERLLINSDERVEVLEKVVDKVVDIREKVLLSCQ